ncbi:hypothetical protein [Pseudoxanthomonas sacheonensis]|uniref:hypothetical protein n=1 Tax=Pseudoxanthomonas sacheonensis TaxID=443615 RepID=UPI0013D74A07|nr:hypothetical protein [Pseudoxanthomonas sacheonensis]
MPKVLSITPALPGWYSVFKEEDGTTNESPVILWALVEDDEDPSMRWPASYSFSERDPGGLATTDDEISNFDGHIYRAP